MAANIADLNKVWEIRVLKKERAEEARKMLEQVAKQVQPIMRKRKWKVRMLSEFSPANPSLLGLNVNRGAEVKIRLRPHGRDSEFFPWEHTLGTMLHELTHNEVGPHNANFYKLLDEITRECEDLMAKGISGTGQGFDAGGVRLGGVTHNPPPTNLRSVAAAAAEKRLKVTQVMPSGPRKLGGDRSLMRDLPPGVAAAMAAERRAADDKWCAGEATAQNESDEAGFKASQEAERGDGDAAQAGGAVSSGDARRQTGGVASGGASTSRLGGGKGSGDGFGETSEHTGSGGVSGGARRDGARGVQTGGSARAASSPRNKETLAATAEKRRRLLSGEDEGVGRSWSCAVCTLENNSLALQCGVCGALRSAGGSASVSDHSWHCQTCTLENPVDVQACSACGKLRDDGSADRDTVVIDADGPKGQETLRGKGEESSDIKRAEGRGRAGLDQLQIGYPLRPPSNLGTEHSGRPADSSGGETLGGELQKGWSCRFCTLRNELRSSKCAACEQWRYSNGAPLTHRPVTET